MTDKNNHSDAGQITWDHPPEPHAVSNPPLPFYARPSATPSAIPPHLEGGKEPPAKSLKSLFSKKALILMVLMLVLVGLCLFSAGFFYGLWVAKKHASASYTHAKKKTASKLDPLKKNIAKILKQEPETLYSVQLGALLNRLNAEELAKYLQQENISSKIVIKQRRNAPPLFIVRTQEYASYTEAKTIADTLISKHMLSATVVKVGKG
ncbi:SPOR domain-containing protein [bacterium NHP-B]|nr:SPOR domain-containing protein [bacterium NHP-B]